MNTNLFITKNENYFFINLTVILDNPSHYIKQPLS